ncbi:MAG: 3-phosphoshikimate 1-carboxyvinyltransferase [Candidatus Omnitrophota bacterium]
MKVVKIIVPPDKSISHRAVMLSSIAEGATYVSNLLAGDDCLHTIRAFRSMGVKISSTKVKKNQSIDIIVKGLGLRGLKKPDKPLYLGNSGTTMRILPGILAGQDFSVILKGDRSLSSRPMLRIAEPLMMMGVKVDGKGKKEIYPPLKIHGNKLLKAINYTSKIASAQVKSCILLASLYADKKVMVREPVRSRDHTERMLKMFGASLKIQGNAVTCSPSSLKTPHKFIVPGDISSAAFFIAAGLILPDTKIILKDVGLNPTRAGILDILKRMGAKVQIKRKSSFSSAYEPYGDIIVKHNRLKGIDISPEEVVRAIDEIPIVMLLASLAKGRTTIRGVRELRYKETDRIKSMLENISKIGGSVEVKKRSDQEDIIIEGCDSLQGGKVSSFGDHRTAMAMLVAGLVSKEKITVSSLSCINKSFPGFQELLKRLK